MRSHTNRFAQGEGCVVIAKIDAAPIEFIRSARVIFKQTRRSMNIAVGLSQRFATVETFDNRQPIRLSPHQPCGLHQDRTAPGGRRVAPEGKTRAGTADRTVHIRRSARRKVTKDSGRTGIKALHPVATLGGHKRSVDKVIVGQIRQRTRGKIIRDQGVNAHFSSSLHL